MWEKNSNFTQLTCFKVVPVLFTSFPRAKRHDKCPLKALKVPVRMLPVRKFRRSQLTSPRYLMSSCLTYLCYFNQNATFFSIVLYLFVCFVFLHENWEVLNCSWWAGTHTGTPPVSQKRNSLVKTILNCFITKTRKSNGKNSQKLHVSTSISSDNSH